MAAEAAVLEGGELGEVAAVDGGEVDRQAPAPVGDGVGGEERAVAVENDGRGGGREGREDGRVDPAVEGDGGGGEGRARAAASERGRAPPVMRPAYRGRCTVPASVRAR